MRPLFRPCVVGWVGAVADFGGHVLAIDVDVDAGDALGEGYEAVLKEGKKMRENREQREQREVPKRSKSGSKCIFTLPLTLGVSPVVSSSFTASPSLFAFFSFPISETKQVAMG